MAETAKLDINIRPDVSKVERKRLRREGYLLGNISRKGMDSVAIAVKLEEFHRALKNYGRNAVFTLSGDDNTNYNVMVKDVVVTPPAYDFIHVDFHEVSLTETVKADVAIRFVGAEFVEAKRLIINRLMDVIPVKGLPQDIPDDITIEVTKMELGDSVSIADVKFPEGITPDIETDQMVLTINEAKTQAEETKSETVETESETETV
ncbi:MAG: 50S ribosomal protein L25 [Lachnospiraceae bacterium]|jgi:large subunit ribosomal protein L25|nr:50S ribosomal protein L25 [Lachnospiraceae bacterium]